jgi:hypothetical protein
MAATIAMASDRADFSANVFRATVIVTLAPGTQYWTGGIGPIAAQLAFNISTIHTVPIFSQQNSMSNPPSGINWVYNYVTDKIQAYVTGASASGSPPETGELIEYPNGAVIVDTVAVLQTFKR